MDGLLLYKQYLENVRKDILNYELTVLDSKKFLDILNRVHEIEDLSYIDTILKSAGLDLSFWNSKDFLEKLVEVKSNLGKLYVDDFLLEEDAEVLDEYISAFADKEDEINETLDYIYGEDGFGEEEIYADNFIGSEDEFPTIENMLENNKDTLGALFGFMKKVEKKEEEYKEENEVDKGENKEEKVFDTNIGVEEVSNNYSEEYIEDTFEDIDFTNSDFVSFEDIEFDEEDNVIIIDETEIEEELKDEDLRNDNIKLEETVKEKENEDSFDMSFLDEVSDDVVIEELDNKNIIIMDSEENDYNETFDTSFLDETDDVIDSENDDIDTESLKEKDFSIFLDDKDISLEEDNDDDNCFDDTTDEELSADLYEGESPNIFDRDPESTNRFKEATEFFLNSRKLKRNEKPEIEKLREQARQKERLVDHPDVTDGEDALAKVLLSFGLGMMSIPKSTTGIVNKIKEGSKKLTENMIVGDDEDDEND